MHRIVLMMAMLMRAIAPLTTNNGLLNTELTSPVTSTMSSLPTVFRSVRVTSKPRRQQMRQGNADSPMLNYIFDSYATNNKHFHDKFRPPSFEGDAASEDTVIDADTGSNVIFDCRVTALRDKTRAVRSEISKVGFFLIITKMPRISRHQTPHSFQEPLKPDYLKHRAICAGKINFSVHKTVQHLLQVSWLRVADNENLELLTVDSDTHTADARYRVDLAGENWKLALSDAKVADSGIYCCHVSTHPPMLRRFKLIVHPPAIRMNKEAFLETGETLSLKCAILNLHPGDTVPEMHWYRGNGAVTLDEIRGGVSIETDHLTLTSHLQVARLKVEDAGNYTCALTAPLQMRATSRVHVLQGSSLAELQSGVKTTTSYFSLLLVAMVLVFGTMFTDIR